MAARQPGGLWLPPRKPEPMDDLAQLVLLATPEQLVAFAQGTLPEDKALLERIVAEATAQGWRANPATFMHHLQGDSFALWPHVVLLAEHWAGAFRGTENPHQQWNQPSQTGKTTLVKGGLLWALDRNPRLRLMYVTYGVQKAENEAGDVRDLADQFSAELSFQLRPDRRARGQWTTDEGGGLYATGIGGEITGYPADGLVGDDLLKGWEAAHSPAQRARVLNIWLSQVRMRLQGAHCPVILPGTRWHEDDLHATLRRQHGEDERSWSWNVIRLPMLAEAPELDAEDPVLAQPDPLGRAPGEPLVPERFDLDEALARAADLGPYLTAALEQQRPAPVEGGVLKREWWQWYTTAPERADQWLSSWDTKGKDKADGDFVVGQVWARTGADYWGMDQLRGQWSQLMMEAAVALVALRWPQVTHHYVENTGWGPEAIANLTSGQPELVLRDEVVGPLAMTDAELVAVQAMLRRGVPAVIAVTPKGSKMVRALSYQGVLQGHHVHLPEGKLWAASLVNEAAGFPQGHDDQVDAWSQAMLNMTRRAATATTARGTVTRPAAAAGRLNTTPRGLR